MSTVDKIIKILDPQSGSLQETELHERPGTDLPLFEARPGRKMTLEEASTLAEFPVLLRDGVRSIAFDRYMATPTTYQEWAAVERSDKQSEDWAEENQIGELPVIGENNPYPEFKLDLDRTVNIKNYKRGGIIAVTEEMIRFNRLNLLKRQAAQLGRAAARTREQAALSVLTATGNYTRTTADNDIGNNTAATTFSAEGLITALTTLRTMKDRKSGAQLDVMPDTLIVGPRLEFAAKQLLTSANLQIPGDGVTTAKVYGTGTVNPFRGLVNQIIVSARFATSYQWCLMEAKQAVVLQVVDDLQILQESVGGVQHEGYFKYDNVRYRARDWFGAGMLNDRFAFYSSSTTAPAVA
jgi:hypothetical protein